MSFTQLTGQWDKWYKSGVPEVKPSGDQAVVFPLNQLGRLLLLRRLRPDRIVAAVHQMIQTLLPVG